MKATLVFLIGFLLVLSAYGDGQLIFANTASTQLRTNSCCGGIGVSCNQVGLTTGAGQYTVGLYIAPFGITDDSAFTRIVNTPNQSGFGNGRFDGGTVAIQGLTPGSLIAFQIRVWQTAAGLSYEEAQQNTAAIGSGRFFLGKSARGFVVVGPNPTSVEPVPRLMGTNYGQVPGFTLYYGGGPYYGPQNQISDEFFCGFPPGMTNVALNIFSPAGSGGHTVSWNNNVTAYPATFLLEWSSSLSPPQWNAITAGVLNFDNRLNYSAANSSARFYRLRRL